MRRKMSAGRSAASAALVRGPRRQLQPLRDRRKRWTSVRLVFMGTASFAVPCLQALLQAGHQVSAVVTQPDRPAGRGQGTRVSAVKAQAEQAGLRILQPE